MIFGILFFLFELYFAFEYPLLIFTTSIFGLIVPFIYRRTKSYMENIFGSVIHAPRKIVINLPGQWGLILNRWGTLIKLRVEYRRLQNLSSQKQRERDLALEVLRKDYILTDERKAIIELATSDLIQKLQTKILNAENVLAAFIAKSIEANDNFNCITEFIPNAMDIAIELDTMSKTKGPLHGLPVCIKDDTNVKGMDSTLGYAKNLYQPAKDSAVLVKCLINLGAIPYCKTNVPQTLVSFGSDNPIFGRTGNCKNVKLSPGGSSSGTGCLVGAGGTPFGTGTDIGGSGRIPAHFNGVASIKPTSNRLSGKGITQATPNCIGLVGVPTIFAKTPCTVAHVFKALIEENRQNNLDPLAVPVPWNNNMFESKNKLRIGYFTTMSFFPPMGDVEQTVLNAKKTLETLGHTLIPFEIKDDYPIAKIMADLANSDTGKHLRTILKGEKVAVSAQLLNYLIHMPVWLRKLLARIIKSPYLPFFQSKRAEYCLNAGLDLRETTALWDCMGERQKVIQNILSRIEDDKLNLILCPVFPFPAIKVDEPKDLFVAVVYCMLWNLCDFPAGVVRWGTESGRYIDMFNDENDFLLKMAKKSARDSAGMPIGVQIVGKPFNEELVLRVLIELDKARSSNEV